MRQPLPGAVIACSNKSMIAINMYGESGQHIGHVLDKSALYLADTPALSDQHSGAAHSASLGTRDTISEAKRSAFK